MCGDPDASPLRLLVPVVKQAVRHGRLSPERACVVYGRGFRPPSLIRQQRSVLRILVSGMRGWSGDASERGRQAVRCRSKSFSFAPRGVHMPNAGETDVSTCKQPAQDAARPCGTGAGASGGLRCSELPQITGPASSVPFFLFFTFLPLALFCTFLKYSYSTPGKSAPAGT